MAHVNDPRQNGEGLESDVRGITLKEEENGDVDMDTIPVTHPVKSERSASVAGEDLTTTGPNTPRSTKKASRSPIKSEQMAQSPAVKHDEEMVGGDIELKLEPGKPPKLQRKASQKVERRPPPLFFDYENKTAEATSAFTVLSECVYANKYLGTTEHALECDCAEEWGKSQPAKIHIPPSTTTPI